MKKSRNTTRKPILGRDIRSVDTNLFKLGTALIVLRGLNILKVLSDLRFGTPGKNDMIPITTTIKSRTFHAVLRYDF
jgi:hypothetical protein